MKSVPWRRLSMAILAIPCLLAVTGTARAADEPAPAGTPPPAGQPAAPAVNRWESTIQKFEEQDRKSPPPQGAVLFVGSSSIVGWDVPHSFPDLVTIKRGFGGSCLPDSVFYFDRIVKPYAPKVVVLYAGDNDIGGGKSPERIAADFDRFAEKMRSELPNAHLVYLAIKPSVLRWKKETQICQANALIKARCEKEPHFSFLDTHTPLLGADGLPRQELLKPDGLHLNKDGYALWTALLAEDLKAVGSAK